jgi:hypothetical protein
MERWYRQVESPRRRWLTWKLVAVAVVAFFGGVKWIEHKIGDPEAEDRARKVGLQQGQLRWLADLALTSPEGVARGCVDRDVLSQVVRGPLVDLWGRDIAFACRTYAARLEVTLVSSGPDLVPGTADDIAVSQQVVAP